MENAISCLIKGYENLEGTIKAFSKFAVFLTGAIMFGICLMYILIQGASAIIPVEAFQQNKALAFMSLALVALIIVFAVLPIIFNVNTILLREYVLKGSKIRLKYAISEAMRRLNGRFLLYYVKSSSILIGSMLLSFLCGVTLIGAIFVPIIAYLFMVAQVALAYQGEVRIFHVFKTYLKEVVLISFCLFVVTLISTSFSFIGAILISPMTIAPQLFVCSNFK